MKEKKAFIVIVINIIIGRIIAVISAIHHSVIGVSSFAFVIDMPSLSLYCDQDHHHNFFYLSLFQLHSSSFLPILQSSHRHYHHSWLYVLNFIAFSIVVKIIIIIITSITSTFIFFFITGCDDILLWIVIYSRPAFIVSWY